MPDFGDEMGDKLVQMAGRFVASRVRDAWNDYRRDQHEAKREAQKESERLQKEIDKARAAADAGDGLADKIDKEGDPNSVKAFQDFTYRLDDPGFAQPESVEPAEFMELLHERVSDKLSKDGCGGLLSWEFNEEAGELKVRVATDSVKQVSDTLRDSTAQLRDDIEAAEKARAEALEREAAGLKLDEQRENPVIDLSELEIPEYPEEFVRSDGITDKVYRALDPPTPAEARSMLQEAVDKTPLKGLIKLDAADGKVVGKILTEDVDAVNEAARQLLAHRADMRFPDLAIKLSDAIAFKKTFKITGIDTTTGNVSHFETLVPETKLAAFRAAADELGKIIGNEYSLKEDGITFDFEGAEDARSTCDNLETRIHKLSREGKLADASNPLLDKLADSPYLKSKLIEGAKRAAADLAAGSTPPPPGISHIVPDNDAPDWNR